MDSRVLAKIRKICLSMPESSEKETWGHPTFRVRDKMFTTCASHPDPAGGDVRVMTMKAAEGEQESLLAEGHPFFYPSYVGGKGWIGMIVDRDTDWSEVAELVEDSFRQIAPKRVSALLDEGG